MDVVAVELRGWHPGDFGLDVILAAADWARCRELSRRVRDDLIRLGHVGDVGTVRIAGRWRSVRR